MRALLHRAIVDCVHFDGRWQRRRHGHLRGSLESEIKARKTVQEAVKANEQQMDQTELVKLLEEEMLQAAQNLEFERAAQLRDKINELRGAPVIKSGGDLSKNLEGEESKIWRPKQQGRPKGRRVAK